MTRKAGGDWNTHPVGPSEIMPSGATLTPIDYDPEFARSAVGVAHSHTFNHHDQQFQIEVNWEIPRPELRRKLSDPNDLLCPLSKFIGNKKATDRLSRAVYAAWGRSNHCCSDQSFAILGPSSAGKTTLARLFGEAVQLPFIEIQPKSVKNCLELFEIIALTLERSTVVIDGKIFSQKVIMPPGVSGHDCIKTLPPCVVFIDEVHALPSNIIPELLKATEPKDGMMMCYPSHMTNCRNVCWVIATTERGLLFPPFENRFRKVQLDLYSADEVAQIVRINHRNWDMDICRLVAKYAGRVPREALAFATDMVLEADRNPADWEVVAARVARSNDIDPFGLSRKRLNILIALGRMGPVSKGRMCDVAQCQEEELVKFQMPALLAVSPTEPALVQITSRGYSITHQGLAELDKRSIRHKSKEEVVVSDGEKLDLGEYDPDDFGIEDIEPQVTHPIGEEKEIPNEKKLYKPDAVNPLERALHDIVYKPFGGTQVDTTSEPDFLEGL
jgi:Holliday junction resolvasome RuvABC ATP-dependent DNA helicase subunit